jgi:hypothetical protein
MLALVATQALVVRVFGRCFGELEYLARIPAGLDMRFARAMAAFARYAFAAMLKGEPGVGI